MYFVCPKTVIWQKAKIHKITFYFTEKQAQCQCFNAHWFVESQPQSTSTEFCAASLFRYGDPDVSTIKHPDTHSFWKVAFTSFPKQIKNHALKQLLMVLRHLSLLIHFFCWVLFFPEKKSSKAWRKNVLTGVDSEMRACPAPPQIVCFLGRNKFRMARSRNSKADSWILGQAKTELSLTLRPNLILGSGLPGWTWILVWPSRPNLLS